MKKLKVTGPESPEAVEAAYQASQEPHARERLLAISLAQRGHYTLQEIGQFLGRGRSTIARWVKAFRQGGIALLLTRRHQGSPGRVSESLQEELLEGLRQGRWKNARAIQAWLHQKGVSLSRSGGYYWLYKLKASWKLPRKSHVKKKPGAEAAFKAALGHALETLSVPSEGKVRIWGEDDPRSGLISFIRRCGTLKGARCTAPYHTNYEWGYGYAAAEVGAGDLQVLYTPTVSLAWSHAFLRQVVQTDPDAYHIILWDQAGYHPKPEDPTLPEQVSLLPLPPYWPELNPVEGLWDRGKERVANEVWQTLETAEAAITEVLKPLWEQGNLVRALVGKGGLTRGVTAFLKTRNSLIIN